MKNKMRSRRGFLKETGLVCGCALASGLLRNGFASPTTNTQPGLGFSLYGMKSLPIEQAIKICAQIGYEHVEFALNDGYPTAPKVFDQKSREQVRQLLEDANISIPALMVHLSLTASAKAHEENLQKIIEAAVLAHQLSPQQPPLLETVLGGTPDKWEQQKLGMVQQLKDWALTCEHSKIQIALKAHVRSAVNSPERLLWLLEQVVSPSLVLAYDYSHFQLQDMDMQETMKQLLPRTKFIHVKDAVGDANKFEFVLSGEGKTDYVNFFRYLRQLNYQGPVCVEVSGQVFSKPEYDPIKAATSCFHILNQARQLA